MAKPNAYLAKQAAVNHGFFKAGEQTGRQVVLDMMVLALRDPEIIGKDIFGKDRLLKVLKGIEKYMDAFDQAFQATDETDYYRTKLDAALADAFGEGMHDTFSQRYEYCRDYDYVRRRWK